MKEYELLLCNTSELLGMSYVLETAIRQSVYSILDIDRLRVKMDLLFKFIEMKKRFTLINEKVGGKADVTFDGFILNGHKFETLDELDRAINMKAFL